MNFWLQFAISEATAAAQAAVMISTLPPAQKAALQAFIAAGQQVGVAFASQATPTV